MEPSPRCNHQHANHLYTLRAELGDEFEADLIALYRAGGYRMVLAEMALTLTDDEADNDDAALAVQLYALIGARFGRFLRAITSDPAAVREHLRADIDHALDALDQPPVIAGT